MNEISPTVCSTLLCAAILSLGCEDTPPLVPETSASAAEKEQPQREEPAPTTEELPTWSNRSTKDSGFPCEVEKVLSASCRRCHWEPREHDAPFALVKWEDNRETRATKPVFELMKKQISADLMPPVLEVVADPPVEALTPQQKKTLLDWLEAGAERSDEKCSEI
jgi:hypothetical protein